MYDIEKGEVTDLIYGLERINQIIDLCIDRELYEYVEDILRLGKNCSQYITELRNTGGKKSLEEFDFSRIKYPVLTITTPSDTETAKFFQSSELFKSEKLPFDLNKKGKAFHLLKHWSDLLWAKRVRAELQKHNRGEWLERYEDITFFLESRMPTCKPKEATEKDFYTTKFNYLMELSAVAQGEASFGYAERARKLLKCFSNYVDPKRGSYDRWIWWNMGTAYQHVGRNQKAVKEFNRVIEKFPEKLNQLDSVVEYLCNIVPAYLQRAAINLKLQLGYHALQTLEKKIADNLTSIENKFPQNIICNAVTHLRNRIALYRIEALLQLESLSEAENHITQVYSNIFGTTCRKDDNVSLPRRQDHDLLKSIKIQLVEHTVSLLHQKSALIINNIRIFLEILKTQKSSYDGDICVETLQGYNELRNLIKMFFEYWRWVEGNNQDELIFFSRWAQLLKLGMEAVDKLSELEKKLSDFQLNLSDSLMLGEASTYLLEDTIKLYLFLSEELKKMPVKRDERPTHDRTIELENLRSDDLPDFKNGLSTFYKKIRDILSANENDLFNLRAVAERTLNDPSKGKPFDYLRKHHEDLLDALDEYDIEFGENQQIHVLKRCNERLIWPRVNDKTDPNKGCTNCFGEENDSSESFDGLLSCQKKIPRDDEQLPLEERNRFDLLCHDYETIMQETEDHLAEHLERHSLHSPPQKALRFIGLQRWNSLTPAQGKSVGGGYFVYQTDSDGEVELGIAIDPGFDYVRNLFRMGFSLIDVDIVLISHAHPDHLWDFESMVQLLHELEEKTDKIHQLNVVLTLGSYQRLSHIINNPELRRFINPLVIDIRKEIQPDFFKNLAPAKKNNPQNLLNYCFSFSPKTKKQKIVGWQPVLPVHKNNSKNREIEIWPTRAYHEDYSERSDSFGFLIKVLKHDSSGTDDTHFCFGYTGDTKWVSNDLYNQGCPDDELNCTEKCRGPDEPRWRDVASQYADCDVLLMHLGSLINHKGKGAKKFKDYFNAIECEKLIRSKNHPYLMGMIRFLREIYKETQKKKLILMGEFGEELRGGIRTDLVKRLKQGLTKEWQMVPVDVGLDILLHNYADGGKPSSEFEFLCALCDKPRLLSEIDYFRFGQDEAIFYICKTCKKATPADVRQTRLRQLYDIGRKLRTLPH